MVPAKQRGEHHLTLRGLESACARVEKLELVFNINNKLASGRAGASEVIGS
jgi:hypothetical protein